MKFIFFIRLTIQKGWRTAFRELKLLKLVKLVFAVYLIFNIFWGLNYNRLGIAYQLKLEVKPYSEQDLKDLLSVLTDRLCYYGDNTNHLQWAKLQSNAVLFAEGNKTYQNIKNDFPFLTYQNPSLKASLYSSLGHYIGFTGYYNPFTAEAQIKTSIPLFLKPYVLCHEIGIDTMGGDLAPEEVLKGIQEFFTESDAQVVLVGDLA